MVVLNLMQYFIPEYSGSTTRSYNIMKRLPYDTFVITSDRTIEGKKIPLSSEFIDGIFVYRIPAPYLSRPEIPEIIRQISKLSSYYSLPTNPTRIFRNNDPELIHVHNILPFGRFAQYMKKHNLSLPLVAEIHSFPEETTKGITASFQKQFFKNELIRICDRADRTIVLTDSQKEYLQEFYGIPEEKIIVIPNCVDSDMFRPLPEDDEQVRSLQKKLNLEKRVILYAGALDRINGIPDYLSVIPEMAKANPDILWVFAGTGPEYKRVLRFAQKITNIRLIPNIPFNMMPALYQICDIFILPRPSTPSTERIIPLKLLEALAMENVVLGSDVGGIKEVIRDGVNGFLYAATDPGNLAEKLGYIIEQDLSNVRKEARKSVIGKYRWETSAAKLAALYNSLQS